MFHVKHQTSTPNFLYINIQLRRNVSRETLRGPFLLSFCTGKLVIHTKVCSFTRRCEKLCDFGELVVHAKAERDFPSRLSVYVKVEQTVSDFEDSSISKRETHYSAVSPPAF